MSKESRTKLRNLGPNTVRFPGYIRQNNLICYAGQSFRTADAFWAALTGDDNRRATAWTYARYHYLTVSKANSMTSGG